MLEKFKKEAKQMNKSTHMKGNGNNGNNKAFMQRLTKYITLEE